MILLIYAHKSSPRLAYIADELAVRLGFEKSEIITDKEMFAQRRGVKINYSVEKVAGCLQVLPHHLLYEKTICNQKIEWKLKDGVWYFFETSPTNEIPFDIFSLCFFHLCRYEEYLNPAFDQHGRFKSENAVLRQKGLIEIPVVEQYVRFLETELYRLFPEAKGQQEKQFRTIFTFDIDNAWAYKNKGVFFNLAASVKELFTGKFARLKDRFLVVLLGKKDPYDQYDYIEQKIKSDLPEVRFFFLLGDRGQFDKNLSWKNVSLQLLIRRLTGLGQTGIHPSYHSFKQVNKVKTEMERLKKITTDEVKISRQHFLRFQLPESYQILNELGINEEYSMGFADCPGFRAGTCFPFYFYDLAKEERQNMKIVPLTLMDGTLNEYLGLTVEEAKQKSEELLNVVKTYDGVFVALWHNETLSDQGKWKDWRIVFEYQLFLARNSG